MQRVRMVRHELEDLAIHLFRVGELAVLLEENGDRHRLFQRDLAELGLRGGDRVSRTPIVRVRNSRLMAGSTVFVRMASIMRPPLSSSVHRLTMSLTAVSSYLNGILWCSVTRFEMRPSCRRTIDASIASLNG